MGPLAAATDHRGVATRRRSRGATPAPRCGAWSSRAPATRYRADDHGRARLVPHDRPDEADLRMANLGGADLGRADLGGADLTGANLLGADLRSANLLRA